jgi:hypothetical protein
MTQEWLGWRPAKWVAGRRSRPPVSLLGPSKRIRPDRLAVSPSTPRRETSQQALKVVGDLVKEGRSGFALDGAGCGAQK